MLGQVGHRQNGYLSDKKAMFYQKAHYNNQLVGCHFGCHVRFLIYRASYPTLSPVITGTVRVGSS